MRSRVWFNADLESKNYIIPGLIAVIMMVIAALLTSLTVAREWERGTMEQLISTPVKGPELILGKLIPYFAIGMFDVLLAVLMGEFLFHVPLARQRRPAVRHGRDLPGGRARDGHAHQHRRQEPTPGQPDGDDHHVPARRSCCRASCSRSPTCPTAIQVITYLVPARYFIALLKGIYLKGVGLEILAVDAALLVVFAGGHGAGGQREVQEAGSRLRAVRGPGRGLVPRRLYGMLKVG